MRRIRQSQKLQHVRYDVRGPILVEAQRLEAEGHRILKLNIGNPAPFGFEAPDAIVADMIHHLPEAQGYSDCQGIYPARTAVAHYYQERGLRDVHRRRRLHRQRRLRADLDGAPGVRRRRQRDPGAGARTTRCGPARSRCPAARPVHYRCDETNGWDPDLADIESKITEHTHALVIINPNNPTGAVYSEETVEGLVDIARRHDLVVMADEIYEKILYDDAVHHHAATYAGDDVLCLTFSGLSKAYRVCGYRAGWVMISGPKELATDFLEGLTLIANMRMCANVPAQHAIQTALGRLPVDRGADRARAAASTSRRCWPTGCSTRSRASPPCARGARCTASRGSTPRSTPIDDDESFVIDLLRAKRILVTHGTGFNWFEPDHFRLVTLPDVDVLDRGDRPDRRLPRHPTLRRRRGRAQARDAIRLL